MKRELPWAVRLGAVGLPAEKRREVRLLLDFHRRVGRLMREALASGGVEFQTAMQEQIRELGDLYAEGSPADAGLRGLRSAIDRHGLRKRDFSAMIDGWSQMVLQRHFATWSQLDTALHQVAGVPAGIIARILGGDPERTRAGAGSFGKAVRLSAMLMNAGPALDDGRIVFPVSEMAACGVDQAMLAARETTPEFRRLAELQVARLRRFLAEAEPAIGEFPDDGTQRFLRLLLAWQQGVAGRIEAAGFDLFHGGIEFGAGDSLRRVLGRQSGKK